MIWLFFREQVSAVYVLKNEQKIYISFLCEYREYLLKDTQLDPKLYTRNLNPPSIYYCHPSNQ